MFNAVCAFLVLLAAQSALAAADDSVATRAQQILEQNCVECHGGKATRSGFDLTTREGLLKGGDAGAVVESGKATGSRLHELITHAAEPGMPYKRPKLADEDIATLVAWIDAGAEYSGPLNKGNVSAEETWWSLRPLAKPPVPTVPPEHQGAVRNDIDAFVIASLERAGLTPSAPADRRVLLRRVMFDLVGFPPTPAQTAEFLADEAPDAYERLVDRLLLSPQYGERWARHWMDTVHYAETHGHDQDRPRPNAWPYRDYLIRALNEDRPYTRFIQEQLAGDVLFPDDPQGLVAMGFLATGPWDESSLRDIREDAIDREIARYLDRDDMVTTAAATLLSTTAHCARCHGHKFDPISQEEYYRLQAVFSGVDKAERAYDPDPQVARTRAALSARLAALPELVTRADASLFEPELQAAVLAWEERQSRTALLWQPLDPESATSTHHDTTLTRLPDSSVLAGGPRPEKDTYTIRGTAGMSRITGLRLEVLPHESLPLTGPGRQDNGNLHLNEISVSVAKRGATDDAEFLPVQLTSPKADFNQAGWSIEMTLDGNPMTAWGIYPEVGKAHLAIFEFSQPVEFAEGASLIVKLDQIHPPGHLIGRLRLSVTEAPLPLPLSTDVLPGEVVAALRVPAAERTTGQQAQIAAFVLREQLERELAALPPQQKVYSATNRFKPDGSFKPVATPRKVHVLRRGDINQPGREAAPGGLSFVQGLSADFELANPDDESSRRAAFARWVTDERNAIAWRSIVNRVWHYHFGKGLVDTPNDFGRMGALPTHPELLDWLAVVFQESGGSLKVLHRMIVTSATYRQSSQSNAKFAEIDGDNKLLWRMNRLRLDAESIRDATLLISGRLDPTMGGPSVKQFIETPGIHVTPVVDYQNFDVDRPENHRRSVYRFIFRTLPDPFMETLDCADPSQLTPVRGASVTALQALTMLNNKFVVRQSEHIAARLTSIVPDTAGQVGAAYEWILGRPATPHETERVSQYAAKHGLANAVRMLLNSNEFMFVE